jgi:PAS domain S-box-containing protein
MIERWNAAAAAMFGYTLPEALGQSLDLIIPEHLRAVHWRGFEAAMASGTTRLHGRPTLTQARHKSGSRLYVEMSFALVADAAGAVLGAVVIVRDVTERMERERVLAKDTAQGKP